MQYVRKLFLSIVLVIVHVRTDHNKMLTDIIKILVAVKDETSTPVDIKESRETFFKKWQSCFNFFFGLCAQKEKTGYLPLIMGIAVKDWDMQFILLSVRIKSCILLEDFRFLFLQHISHIRCLYENNFHSSSHSIFDIPDRATIFFNAYQHFINFRFVLTILFNRLYNVS